MLTRWLADSFCVVQNTSFTQNVIVFLNFSRLSFQVWTNWKNPLEPAVPDLLSLFLSKKKKKVKRERNGAGFAVSAIEQRSWGCVLARAWWNEDWSLQAGWQGQACAGILLHWHHWGDSPKSLSRLQRPFNCKVPSLSLSFFFFEPTTSTLNQLEMQNPSL